MICEMTIQSPTRGSLERLVRVGAALGEPGRVRLVAACLDAERCVCQLVGLVGLSAATVSRHLTVLRDAGLLISRKDGRWVHYRAAEPEPGTPEADGLAMVARLAESDDAIAADRARLSAICGVPAEEITRRLKNGEPVCPPDCC